MTPSTVVIEGPASSPKLLSLPTVLKVAAILLMINAVLVGWFWISPNWGTPTEQRGLAEGSALAEAKPSPFYIMEDDTRRGAKKAMKLKPIVVETEPVPEVASIEPTTDMTPRDHAQQRAEDALFARYAETRAADRP